MLQPGPKVLSINIRATQGGAGRMGYDLHRRLKTSGVDARLLYGYGSGIAPDDAVSDQPEVQMIGNRPMVIGNYAAHLLLGEELFTPGSTVLREAIDWADVVHVHAAHHWYVRLSKLTAMLREFNKPTVVTAHDWWLVSGRCGFVRDCSGWMRECGECGKRRFQDLPSLFDRSRSVRASRQREIRLLANQLILACPSQHIQRDHAHIYPDLDVRFIPNALDSEYEAAISNMHQGPRRGIVFCASDLASPGKIDAEMVRTLTATYGDAVELIGRASPFRDICATDHGEVRNRKRLAAIFSSARVLVFTSQMDNAPLTIIEALVAGCYVVAYPSPAASEMVSLVGGRCAASPAEVRSLIDSGREADLYGGLSSAELAKRAREIWSGQRLAEAYLGIYDELIAARKNWAA